MQRLAMSFSRYKQLSLAAAFSSVWSFTYAAAASINLKGATDFLLEAANTINDPTNQNQTNGCDGPDDDADATLFIDWTPQNTLYISFILGGMFLVSTMLCVVCKRTNRQYSFDVVFKKDNLGGLYNRYEIMGIERPLSEVEYKYMEEKQIDEREYVEEYLLELIAASYKNHKPIASNSIFDEMLEAGVGAVPENNPTKYSMPTTIMVEVPPDHFRKFCLFERIARPVVLSSFLYEFVFQLPLDLGNLATLGTNLPLIYVKALSQIPITIMYTFFINPTVLFAPTYGASLDDSIYNLYLWLRHPKCPSWQDIKKYLCESEFIGKYRALHLSFNAIKLVILTALAFQIDAEIETDYASMKSVARGILDNTNAFIPKWLIQFSSWLNFAHNQGNDPANFASNAVILLTFLSLQERKIMYRWKQKDLAKAQKVDQLSIVIDKGNKSESSVKSDAEPVSVSKRRREKSPLLQNSTFSNESTVSKVIPHDDIKSPLLRYGSNEKDS